jgi:hypothetical protein
MLLLFGIAKAEIAQSVEQWIENPRVTSSTLVLGIRLVLKDKAQQKQ